MTKKKTYKGLRRTKIRKKSPKQEAADAELVAIKRAYFERFGDGQWAPCQVCGHDVHIDTADVMHKNPRGRGRNDSAENLLVSHGFRWKPAHCHGWADGKPSRIKTMIASEANILNGEQVKWELVQTASLKIYLKTGFQGLRGA